jgi:hypothetical protein
MGDQVLDLIARVPWSERPFIQMLAGLTDRPFRRIIAHLQATALIEEVRLGAWGGRPSRRLALTALGHDRLGLTWRLSQSRDGLLSTLKRDPARVLLGQLMRHGRCLWARAPFVLPAAAVRPERALNQTGALPPRSARHPYRAVVIDLLAGLEVEPDRFITLAMLVDPGGGYRHILEEAFRSLAAWSRRPEFASRARQVPLVVILSAGQARMRGLRAAWQAAQAGAPRGLRLVDVTTLSARDVVHEPITWSESGQRVTLFGGLPLSPVAAACPRQLREAWWAAPASAVERPPLSRPVRARARPGSVRAGSAAAQGQVADLLETGALERYLLDRIGVYPGVSASALAEVLRLDGADVRRAVCRLRRRGLITDLEEGGGGLLLSERGLALLAAQVGLRGLAYCRLRGWPVVAGPGQTARLARARLLRWQDHQAEVMAFLRGLIRYGRARGVQTLSWQHASGLREEIVDAWGRTSTHLVPDALFTVRVTGPGRTTGVDTTCWLEVDRATMAGMALRRKLRRYYRLGQAGAGVRGRLERLLIVVPAGDEGRLQLFRRRLRELDGEHGVHLNARITRWDQLYDGGRGPDPTRPVWRTPHASDLLAAFEER